jgi:hypothetical protein
MDFLFYVPFFCTAAAAVTEILNICFVNVEYFERKKLKVKRAFHFVKIIVACPHRRVCSNCPNQLNVNRQYPIRAHCSIVTVFQPW